MPRVHYVKAARKENPVAKVGEPYYWWKFRYGGKHFSKTHPKPSQLTQSAYLSQVRELSERLDDADADDLASLVDEIASDLEQLGQECQDSLDNMPEALQEGGTGQLLQERYDACEQASSELQSLDLTFESELDEDADEEELDQERQNWLDDKLDEVRSLIDDCEV